MKSNTLYYGDCLDWMDRWLEEGAQESIDLIYLDPPFNSSTTYNMFFSKAASGAQFRAFNDTWFWDEGAVQRYQSFAGAIARPAHRAIVGLHTILGECGMLAYLTYMAERLERMHRLLKPTGSIYLHCDPYASHYLKILMDAIFDKNNFRNEVIWHYRRWTATSKDFQRLHDVILRYSKNEDAFYFSPLYEISSNEQKGRRESWILDEEKRRYFRWQSLKGERYKIWKREEGVKIGDVWLIPFLHPSAKERLGYPTQKPEALLERILQASSNEGDVVLDPFCGSGTTCAVAQRLQRHYLGIDQAQTALTITKRRLA